jgi:hypothetical protein
MHEGAQGFGFWFGFFTSREWNEWAKFSHFRKILVKSRTPYKDQILNIGTIFD